MAIRRNPPLGRTVSATVPNENHIPVTLPTTSGVAPDPPDGTPVCPPKALGFPGKEPDLPVDDTIPGPVFLVTAPLPPKEAYHFDPSPFAVDHTFHIVPSTLAPLVPCPGKPNTDLC